MEQKQQGQSLQQEFEQVLVKFDEEEHPDALLQALNFVEKIFNNIAMNPMEQKFRNIKTTNKTLKEKLFNIAGIQRLFELVGYTFDGETYTLPDSGIINILSVMTILRDYQGLTDCKLNKTDKDIEKQLEIIKQRKIQQQEKEAQNKEKQRLNEQFQYDNQNRKTYEGGVSSKAVKSAGFGGGKKVTAADIGCQGSKGG